MILFFHGPDTFTLSREIKKIKSEFVGLVEELEIGNTPDSELTIRLRETLESQGLFANKKLVVLKNFLGQLKNYPRSEEYLMGLLSTPSQSPSPRLRENEAGSDHGGDYVIFEQTEKFDKRLKFFKTLQKEAQAKEFMIPSGTDLEIWVGNYLRNQGFTMEPEALAEFVNLMGRNEEESLYDLWQVSSELEKLMLFSGEEKIIRITAVRVLVCPNISQNVFSLTNLFAEGRGAEAQKLLDDLMGSGPAYELKTQTIQIIGALASQIRSLLLVKDLEKESPAGIAATLGWKEGRVWINSKLARKFTKEKLMSMMRDLRALDLRLKTSEEPPKLLLSLFLQKAKV